MEDHGHRASVLVGNNRNGYARSGKVMLASLIFVFLLIIFIACFHSYANRTRRRRHLRRQHLRRRLTTATADTNNSDALDCSVLKSLPSFLYTEHSPPLECAVCLSEFELGESGRVLPNCKHCFHTECIDMWFESHSTCPLCRAPVEPIEFVAISIDDEPAGSSGLCRPGRMRSSASTPALLACLGSEREIERKRGDILGICIEEVPSLMDSGCSRGGVVGKSTGVLSLKRIWSF